MAVSLFFGLPGCGKTTLLTVKALKAVKSGRYSSIYSNVHIAVPGVTYIDNDCIGKFDLRDCLILIDEGTLFADSRGHKEFGKDKISFFLLHRHYNCDIIIFTQQWDGVDKKIRVITDRVYYVYKGFLLGKWITSYYRIPYGIIIPDPKKANGEKLGDIVQGYCKPNFLIRLFCPKIFRPRYYKYFDSWEAPALPMLPLQYQVYCPENIPNTKVLFCCVNSFYAKSKLWIQERFQLLSSFFSGLRGSLHTKGKYSKKDKSNNSDSEIYR